MVQTKKKTTSKILSLLLCGRHPQIKKYAGKYVFVSGEDIILMREGEEAWRDFARLERKHGQPPTLVFVPRPDISYILILW